MSTEPLSRPAQSQTPPAQDRAAPGQDEAAPARGQAAPGQDEAAPAQGQAAPGQDEAAPAQGQAAPGQDQTAPTQCSACGAAIAANQRYCLECGERLAPISDFLLGARAADGAGSQAPPSAPPAPPGARQGAPQRSGLLVALAGVGVLLVAMGVGVLIGRAGSSRPAAPPVRVITEPGAAAASTAGAEASFASDWPAGKSGYTVELSTLPTAGSTTAAVSAAKAAATAKGAGAVGALDSDEFASLPPGSYVIYSGVYGTRAQAQKGLAGLRKSFPAASVIHVAGGARGGGGGGGSSAGHSSSGSGGHTPPSSLSHPAPPSVLKNLNKKGKNYEEESKNLPNVVETG